MIQWGYKTHREHTSGIQVQVESYGKSCPIMIWGTWIALSLANVLPLWRHNSPELWQNIPVRQLTQCSDSSKERA